MNALVLQLYSCSRHPSGISAFSPRLMRRSASRALGFLVEPWHPKQSDPWCCPVRPRNKIACNDSSQSRPLLNSLYTRFCLVFALQVRGIKSSRFPRGSAISVSAGVSKLSSWASTCKSSQRNGKRDSHAASRFSPNSTYLRPTHLADVR